MQFKTWQDTDYQFVQSLSKLIEIILQDLYKIMEFKGDYDDNPQIVLGLIRTFSINVITHLSKKVETIRPGYGDKLLTSINEATKEYSTERGELVEKITPADYLEKSVSGIASDDLATTVDFLANKIKDEINVRFEELPISSRNETTLLCSLGIIVARIFEENDHKDLDHFIAKFSGVVRTFVIDGQDSNSNQG